MNHVELLVILTDGYVSLSTFEAALSSKKKCTALSFCSLIRPTGNSMDLWTIIFSRTSAFSAPSTTKATFWAAFTTGTVIVILRGGGFGEFSIGAIHFLASSSKGCCGNNEHVWPSGPIPKNKTLILGHSPPSDPLHSDNLLCRYSAATSPENQNLFPFKIPLNPFQNPL